MNVELALTYIGLALGIAIIAVLVSIGAIG